VSRWISTKIQTPLASHGSQTITDDISYFEGCSIKRNLKEIEDLTLKLNHSKRGLQKAELEIKKYWKLEKELSATKIGLKNSLCRNTFLEQALAHTTYVQGAVLNDIFKSRVSTWMALIPKLFSESESLPVKIVILSLWRSQVSKLLYLFAKWTGFCIDW